MLVIYYSVDHGFLIEVVIHDGRMNTYSFLKDCKKITLTPLKSPSPLDPKTILIWMSFSPLFSNLSTMSMSPSKT